MEKTATLIGRILMAHIFLLAGISKITGYAATQGWMESMGVSGMLLPLVILLEIGGGLALILGWQTRWAALALAGFSILAALIFHHNFADQTDMIMFMKDFAMAGGLVYIGAFGAGAWSLDARRAHKHERMHHPHGHAPAH
jgi:putative oxidoreductase